jgi:hypothetical protein
MTRPSMWLGVINWRRLAVWTLNKMLRPCMHANTTIANHGLVMNPSTTNSTLSIMRAHLATFVNP